MDVSNKFLVSLGGDDVVILRQVPARLSKKDALNLAAYLVAMADDAEEFNELLDAVQSS